MNKFHILVVDDEESLCEILKFNLEREGYNVTTALSAEEALTLNLSTFDLMIIDVMMGELSGFGFARILRKKSETAETPIIFCTARDSVEDKIKGLDIGADDYIPKPFSIAEVVARVRSVLRRSKRHSAVEIPTPTTSESGIIVFEGLEVNTMRKSCSVDGEEVSLTRKEFDILVLLLESRGTILSREQIMKRVWSNEVVVLDRTIDVNITRMRKKLGQYGNYIITRTGYGYGFEA
ncbi:MAG: response regulator transcription factor [Alistipes sp.]|nr:response regulator transcription factor [Alistipes sp.]